MTTSGTASSAVRIEHPRAWIGVAVLLSLVSGCQAVTRADEYSTAPLPPDTRLCAECENPELRRVPCPPGPETEGPSSGVAYFALRAIDLGAQPASWSVEYDVGLDLDCSDRPAGKPAQCTPQEVPEGLTRTSLPYGIDNAFATQVLAPLLLDPRFNPQLLLNESLVNGENSLMLVLNDWNGTPNDPQVGARLVPLRGVVGKGAPRWDGSDQWVAYSEQWDMGLSEAMVPQSTVSNRFAYMSDGILVWDLRTLGTVRITLAQGGAAADLDLTQALFMGRISSTEVTEASIAGLWRSGEAVRHGAELADLVAGCNPARCEIRPLIQELVAAANDMASAQPAAQAPCNAISVGIGLGMYRTGGIPEIVPPDEKDGSCRQAAPCR